MRVGELVRLSPFLSSLSLSWQGSQEPRMVRPSGSDRTVLSCLSCTSSVHLLAVFDWKSYIMAEEADWIRIQRKVCSAFEGTPPPFFNAAPSLLSPPLLALCWSGVPLLLLPHAPKRIRALVSASLERDL